MNTPNFFVVGVTKAGTSSLHSWLSAHPDVSLAPKKELHFYCECPARLKSVPDMAAYKAVFRSAAPTTAVIGEASPCYSYYPSVADQLARNWPEARILISLRDPVERFWSHYLMNEWYHPHTPDAAEVVNIWERSETDATAVDDIVGSGMYHDQLQRLLEAFGPKRLLVTTLEDLSTKPRIELSRIFEFLGLREVPVDLAVREKAYAQPRNRLSEVILHQPALRRWAARNVPAGVRRLVKYRILGDVGRRPEPDPDLARRLQSIYQDDVDATAELLGRPLPWRHFPSVMSL